jgi:antirestriction protein ArdC
MSNANTKVYQIVTEKILQDMQDTQTLPWHRPWHGLENLPSSGNTKKPYRGANIFLLAMMQKSQPYWYTYKQIQAIAKKEGCEIRPTAKTGMPVVFSKPRIVKDKKTGEDKFIGMLVRYYTVFNAEDCKGLPEKYLAVEKTFDHDPIVNCEQILATMDEKPVIQHGGNSAHYSPATDSVTMPKRENFETAEGYYAVLFHELIHWTGKRLNRDMSGKFGNESYSHEELIAEFGSAMLCGICGIDNTIQNSAAYIQNWASKFKNDETMIVKCAAKAQKAVDYILGTVFENAA